LGRRWEWPKVKQRGPKMDELLGVMWGHKWDVKRERKLVWKMVGRLDRWMALWMERRLVKHLELWMGRSSDRKWETRKVRLKGEEMVQYLEPESETRLGPKLDGQMG
jgi:hypothetical protein